MSTVSAKTASSLCRQLIVLCPSSPAASVDPDSASVTSTCWRRPRPRRPRNNSTDTARRAGPTDLPVPSSNVPSAVVVAVVPCSEPLGQHMQHSPQQMYLYRKRKAVAMMKPRFVSVYRVSGMPKMAYSIVISRPASVRGVMCP